MAKLCGKRSEMVDMKFEDGWYRLTFPSEEDVKMNYMEQVAKMLGVKLEEKFKLGNYDEEFYINDSGLNCTDHGFEYDEDSVLREILCGEEEIIKLPWKPNYCERYWAIEFNKSDDKLNFDVLWWDWHNTIDDYNFYVTGNIFKSEKEARAAIPWLKENIERVDRGEKWVVEK